MKIGDRRRRINVALLLLALAASYTFLNVIVEKTDALEGLSLGEFLADEFRIQFLPLQDNSHYACNNGSTLLPLCDREFTGGHVRIPKYRVSINSFGIRDKEYSFEKTENTYRIFVLGDSNTFGEGVDISEVYTEVVEAELNEFEGKEFEVFNLGVGGMSTDDEYKRLLHYWDYNPDMVVLQSHPNDILECGDMVLLVDQHIEDELGSELPEINVDDDPETRIERNRLRDQYASSLKKDMQCSCVKRYLDNITNLTTTSRTPLLLLEVDYAPGTSCFTTSSGISQRASVGDLGRRYRLSRGDAHFNAAGHEVLADTLMSAISKELEIEMIGREE